MIKQLNRSNKPDANNKKKRVVASRSQYQAHASTKKFVTESLGLAKHIKELKQEFISYQYQFLDR